MKLAARNLTDLQAYIEFWESNRHLVRVRSQVDSRLELAGIAKKLEGGKAVFFEKIKDSNYPVLTGLYWNVDILATLFESDRKSLPFSIAEEIKAWRRSPQAPEIVDRGAANEVVEVDPDLGDIPVPHHAEGDGGPYLTSSVVIAKDPDTGVRNASIHRMMVTGKRRLTLLLEELGHLMDYYRRAEAKGQPLEITVNNGVDCAVIMAAAIPSSAAPLELDELGLASQLYGEPIRLLRSQTVDVEGIASAQFIIEGHILPGMREAEGPYAEVTGYYAERENRWVMDVTALTRRESPVFHTILSGREVSNAYAMIAGSGVFEKINSLVPEVTAVCFAENSVPYHLLIQIDKKYEGVQRSAMMAAFVSLEFLKTVTIVDLDVDIYNLHDVDWAVQTRCQYDKDLLQIPACTGHRLNPSVVNDQWTRLGIDATVKLPREEKFIRARMKEVDLQSYELSGL